MKNVGYPDAGGHATFREKATYISMAGQIYVDVVQKEDKSRLHVTRNVVKGKSEKLFNLLYMATWQSLEA